MTRAGTSRRTPPVPPPPEGSGYRALRNSGTAPVRVDQELAAPSATCRPALGASYVTEPLHVDDNLVSAHAWPDPPGFMREFLRRLEEFAGNR